jgi:hypothetical protein
MDQKTYLEVRKGTFIRILKDIGILESVWKEDGEEWYKIDLFGLDIFLS